MRVAPTRLVFAAAALTAAGGSSTAAAQEPAPAEADRPPGPSILSIAGGFEIGSRRFDYEGSATGAARSYKASGIRLVRFAVEIAPLASSRNRLASRLAVLGSYARSEPFESDAEVEVLGLAVERSIPTRWRELDGALAYRYRFARGDAVGVVVGYGVHSFTYDFDGETEVLHGSAPDVRYEFLSAGLDGRVPLGRFAVLVDGGVRFLRSTGDLGRQLARNDVIAYYGGGGIAFGVTRTVEIRLAGRYDGFRHSFAPRDPTAIDADGATDRFVGGSLSAVFAF